MPRGNDSGRWARAAGRDLLSLILPWFPQNLVAEVIVYLYGTAVAQSADAASELVNEVRTNRSALVAAGSPHPQVTADGFSVLSLTVDRESLVAWQQALVRLVEAGEGALAAPLAETIGEDLVLSMFQDDEWWVWRTVFNRVALEGFRRSGYPQAAAAIEGRLPALDERVQAYYASVR